jgi:serine/threonine protein phosphatase PrpC
VKVSLASTVEPGKAGPRHEDFYCVETSLGLFAIAEGLGPAGGLLARMVLRTLRQFMVDHRRHPERAAHMWPSHRLQVGLMVAYRALVESAEQADGQADGEAAAVCAMLFDGERLAIARFGGCRAYRLRGDRFEKLGEDIFDGEARRTRWQGRGRGTHDEPSLALEIHDVRAEGDDHWLLGTSGLPDQLTADESQLVIDASESSDLPGGRKPVVDVAARDGQNACNVVIVGTANVSRTQGQTRLIQ